jgi:hypothetical protein
VSGVRVDFARIPADLRELDQWVLWRYEADSGGDRTKVPYQADGRKAASTKPETWTAFEAVRAALKLGGFDGIGFVVSAADPYCGVDFDVCIDVLSGDLDSSAAAEIALLDSYSEISPSGLGVRVFLRGSLSGRTGRKRGHRELYDDKRFLTVTGEHLGGTPLTVEDRQPQLEILHERIFGTLAPPPSPASPQPVAVGDEQLLERAFHAKNGAAIEALWRGETSAYGGDDSAADLALCAHLAFYTDRDPARIDRIFRASGLLREKWDEPRGESTYGAWTIAKAIAGTPAGYTSAMGDTSRAATTSPRTSPQPRPEAADAQTVWFESAADLLAEPDPGPTSFLVDELIVEGSIVAWVGPPKNFKTWTLLDIAIAVATGELALDRFAVPTPGPVLLILEESGRTALHRRLDMLTRGRALEPGRLVELYFAANRRVRLNDLEWQKRLLDAATSHAWRLIAFDPLARIKGAGVDENVQREIGPVLDFLRDLRDASSSTVGYVQHTGHEGTRQRGSSDLEAYWESKLTLVRNGNSRTLRADHREAEGAGPYVVSFGFDMTTRTLRLRAIEGELEQRVREYLAEHPTASSNEVDDHVEGSRQRILELVREYRESGSGLSEPPDPTLVGSDVGGGSHPGAYRAPGTTPADLEPPSGSDSPEPPRNHPGGEVSWAEAEQAVHALRERTGEIVQSAADVIAEARRLRGES